MDGSILKLTQSRPSVLPHNDDFLILTLIDCLALRSAMELCEAQLSNMVEFTMKDLPLKSELAWDCLQAYKLVGGVLERDLVLHRKLLKLRPFDPSISDLLESWRSKSLSQKDIQTILTRGKK